jgi:hypothetical protein
MIKDKKTVEFTKEQFLTLMKAVYLGNWMANANRNGSEEDPHIEEYENIEDYIFSFAPQFGLNQYVDLEYSSEGKYFPTRLFEEATDINKLQDEYDEEVFWSELPDSLGDRDFYNKYSQEDWSKMTQDGRFLRLQECIIKWEEELIKNGIERLGIIEDKKDGK